MYTNDKNVEELFDSVLRMNHKYDPHEKTVR